MSIFLDIEWQHSNAVRTVRSFKMHAPTQLQTAYWEMVEKMIDLEKMYYEEVRDAKKGIMRYFIDIPGALTEGESNLAFYIFYDVHSPVRNNVETLDSIEVIRNHIKNEKK